MNHMILSYDKFPVRPLPWDKVNQNTPCTEMQRRMGQDVEMDAKIRLIKVCETLSNGYDIDVLAE